MMIQRPTKPISRSYAVKSDDDPRPTKPISRNYAVKSDDDPKTNKEPISRNYAVKSDDDPKTKKTNIQELCHKKRWWSKDQQFITPGKSFIQFFPGAVKRTIKILKEPTSVGNIKNVDFHKLWETKLWKFFFLTSNLKICICSKIPTFLQVILLQHQYFMNTQNSVLLLFFTIINYRIFVSESKWGTGREEIKLRRI